MSSMRMSYACQGINTRAKMSSGQVGLNTEIGKQNESKWNTTRACGHHRSSN